MDEKLRAVRRRRRRERRLIQRVWSLAPLALLVLALMLSAGVVKLMEVPRAPAASPVAEPETLQQDSRSRSFSAPDTRPELPAMLSTSVLDDAFSEMPAPRAPVQEPHPAASPAPLPDLEPAGRMDPIDALPDEPQVIGPVPEPASAVLVAGGLVGVAASRRRSRRD